MKNLIPNLALFFGLYCLIDNRPFQGKRLSSKFNSWPALIQFLNLSRIDVKKIPSLWKRFVSVGRTSLLSTKYNLRRLSINLLNKNRVNSDTTEKDNHDNDQYLCLLIEFEKTGVEISGLVDQYS